MAKSKVSHNKRIELLDYILPSALASRQGTKYIGGLLSFTYRTDNSYDKNPIVYVTSINMKERLLHGFNINYLIPSSVKSLLNEELSLFGKKNLKHYRLYENSIRTYKMDHMKAMRLAEYNDE